MNRLAKPSQNQLIALGVLMFSAGAVFSPPLQVLAQPPQSSSEDNDAEAAGTPQPLATPVTGDSTTGRSTRAIGAITGQGTAGSIAKFTGPNAIGNSVLFENAGKIGIGTTTPPGLLSVKSTATNIYPIYGLGAGNAILGSSSGGIGLYGQHTNTNGDQSGVLGESSSTSANASGVLGTIKSTAPGTLSAGVRGLNLSKNANGFGLYGSHAGGGAGVYGVSPSGKGVWGDSATGVGVYARHTSTSGAIPAILGESSSTADNAAAIKGVITSTTPGAASIGVWGANNATGNSGVGLYGTHAGSGDGVYGSAPSGIGVVGQSDTGIGVQGTGGSYGVYASGGSYGVYASGGNDGVYASSGNDGVYASGGNHGVYASSTSGFGVFASSTSGYGMSGYSSTKSGVRGSSDSSYGVEGVSNTGQGVHGESFGGRGVYGYGYVGLEGDAKDTSSFAGYFKGKVTIDGNLQVNGTLSKNAGSFKIDHPQHPATEYLSHSFVESPDMMNVYNGNTTTNSNGEAWVRLPSYFQALNRDFRYQLTPMGQFAQAIVGQKISGNRFLIRTDKPNVEVSWQVTGIRNDVYARQHRIRVEETKTGADRGKYLYPAGFGAGEDKLIGPGRSRLAKR